MPQEVAAAGKLARLPLVGRGAPQNGIWAGRCTTIRYIVDVRGVRAARVVTFGWGGLTPFRGKWTRSNRQHCERERTITVRDSTRDVLVGLTRGFSASQRVDPGLFRVARPGRFRRGDPSLR